MFNLRTISIEFCLVTLLLLLIFIVNILHILYLIIYPQTKQIRKIRLILINYSFSSLFVSVWLIPFFYFRTIWSAESFAWRLWSFTFHIIDTVQLYSLLLLITTRSFQRIFICFIWLIPIIAYSPLLWLNSPYHHLDYLPYRRLTQDVPWWILPILYFSMYCLPMLISLILSCIHLCWPLILYYYNKKENFSSYDNYEHHQDMTELTNLVKTVFNFHLEQSTNNKTCLSSYPHDLHHSISYKIGQHESLFLFDELSTCSLIHTPPIKPKSCLKQPLNSYILFIITCLLLLVHLPYIVSSFFELTTLQLCIFIYIHWFGTMFLPMIHIK
ncbi:hypothetical protein I4U23_009539 [Adineta vaga]|nr:hypothetical protein I4U23_009539 [Adineta vaga]